MIDLTTPWDMFTILLTILASIYYVYLWKITKHTELLLISFIFYILIVVKFIIGLQGDNIIATIVYLTVPALLSKLAYDYKQYTLILTISVYVIITYILIAHLGYEFHGETMLFILLYGWVWYNYAKDKRCFNPLHCSIYKFKPIK